MMAQPDAVRVDTRTRTVRLFSQRLIGEAGRDARRLFLTRVFSCRAVERVEIEADRGAAVIRLSPQGAPLPAAVVSLASAIRGRPTCGIAAPEIPADACLARHARVARIGQVLTTWRVSADAPDALRLQHPLLRRDRLAAGRLERFVQGVPGVLEARLTLWTHELLVRFDVERLDAVALVSILQRAVDEGFDVAAKRSHLMAVSSASLAMAAASDLMIPILAPASAVMLVGTNLSTLGMAVREILRRRPGMATLASAIIVCTLATGQFLASGLMAWSFDFWRRRHRREIEAERGLLLEEATALPRLTEVLTTDGAFVVDSTSVLRGDRIRLAAGDELAVDGVVTDGNGVVEDRWLSGRTGVRSFGVGDRLMAGALIVGGHAELLADGPASRTRMAALRDVLDLATRRSPGRIAPTAEAERYADALVLPTLATAGVGLLAGGVGTAAAVMRPDYSTAEAMTGSFEDLDAITRCLAMGCVPCSPAALDMLAGIDALVVVDHPGLDRSALTVSGVVTSAEDDREFVRYAASLAHHLTDERSDALAAAARHRGIPLLQTRPVSFGGERIEILEVKDGRRCVLGEADASDAVSPRPLVLEIDGHPVATFTFAIGAVPRAVGLGARLQSTRTMETILINGDNDANGDRLSAKASMLRFDRSQQVAGFEGCERFVRDLMAQGRRVAVVTASVARWQSDAKPLVIRLGMAAEPPDETAGGEPHSIMVLDGDVVRLADLFGTAVARRCRQIQRRRLAILPNLMCVAGVFLLGFTSIVAAIVSNAATLGTYHNAVKDRRRQRLRLGHGLPERRRRPQLSTGSDSVVSNSGAPS